MTKKIEEDTVNFVLNSYMESDIREMTDEEGFCRNHINKLQESHNSLGISLMLHTHTVEINKNLKPLLKNASSFKKTSFFKQKDSSLEELIKYLSELENNCFICNKIDSTFKRYVKNFFHLFKNNEDMVTYVKNCKGFCLPHFKILLSESEKNLNSKYSKLFLDIVIPKQLENMQRLENEISLFIDKFDYRNSDKPWGDFKDSLPRLIQKLAGD